MSVSTTLLIYMAADNNLTPYADKDLERIIQASIHSDMHIIVQLDRNQYVDATHTFRYVIEKGQIAYEEDLGETNGGDPRVLRKFIEDSIALYPSEKLIVILWSHGLGIDDSDPYPKVERKRYYVPEEEIQEIAFSYDDTANDFLDNLELQKALSVSVEIDILGFDACLMGMIEIAYQLKEQTKVMVASQHLEPAEGWDYERILGELDTSSPVNEMGKQLILFHDEYHGSKEENVTKAAIDTDVINRAVDALDTFAEVLRAALKEGDQRENKQALRNTLENSQFFGRRDYVDLIDFVEKVKSRLAIKNLEIHADNLVSLLKKMIVANHTIGYFMNDAHGISIYFPNHVRPMKKTFEMYEMLDFAEACPNWVKLLKWYWLD
jgi:hypothetical protein